MYVRSAWMSEFEFVSVCTSQACGHVHMHTHIHVCVCGGGGEEVCACVCVWACACVLVHMHVCVHAHMWICVWCKHVATWASVYVSVCHHLTLMLTIQSKKQGVIHMPKTKQTHIINRLQIWNCITQRCKSMTHIRTAQCFISAHCLCLVWAKLLSQTVRKKNRIKKER